MSDIKKLTEKIKKFRDARDWKQFHTSKNLAESLVLEAAEVLEHFQWKTEREVRKYIRRNRDSFSEELADVLNYLLLLADETGVDLYKATIKKLRVSAKKYPVNKSKGKHTKYTKL